MISVSAKEQFNPKELKLDLAPFSIGNPIAIKKPLTTVIPGNPNTSFVRKTPEIITQIFKAKSGDTIVKILSRAGVSKLDIQKSMAALKKIFNPKKFQNKQDILINFKTDSSAASLKKARLGNFTGFKIRSSFDTFVEVTKTSQEKFKANSIKRNLEIFLSKAEGKIVSNLYNAGKKSGLTESTLAKLIHLFSWDVDFQRDIRKNDLFQVMFEKVIAEDGNVVRSNNIIFATLTLSGKKSMIYQFKNKNGEKKYYSEKGQSIKKALLRTPTDGARLSSGFGKRRHPILGYTMMHRGIDFAAPAGTPIYAAGHGTVIEAKWKGAYGKFILIKHNNEYSSAYAHMRNFEKKIKAGTRVKQGQIIGYIGSTGRSTGPHLHYEIRRKGRRINPLRIKMPSGKKLVGAQARRFKKIIKNINKKFTQLETQPAITKLTQKNGKIKNQFINLKN